MRIVTDPRLPTESGLQQVGLKLTSILRDVLNQLNNLTEGRISAVTNAQSVVPAAGTNSQGDFVRNSTPTELGTAGSKYTIQGWACVTSGSPGTWVQVRALTGN